MRKDRERNKAHRAQLSAERRKEVSNRVMERAQERKKLNNGNEGKYNVDDDDQCIICFVFYSQRERTRRLREKTKDIEESEEKRAERLKKARERSREYQMKYKKYGPHLKKGRKLPPDGEYLKKTSKKPKFGPHKRPGRPKKLDISVATSEVSSLNDYSNPHININPIVEIDATVEPTVPIVPQQQQEHHYGSMVIADYIPNIQQDHQFPAHSSHQYFSTLDFDSDPNTATNHYHHNHGGHLSQQLPYSSVMMQDFNPYFQEQLLAQHQQQQAWASNFANMSGSHYGYVDPPALNRYEYFDYGLKC